MSTSLTPPAVLRPLGRYCIAAMLIAFSCSALNVAAKKAPETSAKTTEATLSNGLKVIIREDHRSPMVMTQIWYAVGSTDESGNTLGVSHVLEHMMFKGTHNVPKDEFTRLSRIYGGSINASTFTNYTQYHQLYPKAYFPLALELESDRMQNLSLRQEDFDTEIKVVMEERRQRTDDNPRARANERFKWLTYPTSHYRQPVIGHMKTLEKIQLSDVKNWYQQWYRPNNATLVIVGDVEPKQALAQVQHYFGKIAAHPTPSRNDVTEFEPLGYRHLEISEHVQTANLSMAWNVQSISTAPQAEDAYALNILRSVLDSGISSRLQAKLVREQKLLTVANVSYDPYNRGDSLFSISAIPAQGVTLQQAQEAIQAEIDLLQKQPVDARELKRVADKFMANLVYNQDDISAQAKMIGNLAVNGLSYRVMDDAAQYLKQVKPADIQRVAQQYLKRDRLSTMYLSPQPAQK